MPPRKTHRNSVTGVPPSPVLVARNISPRNAATAATTPTSLSDAVNAQPLSSESRSLMQDDADDTWRPRSKTIASTTVKREAKLSDIVTLDHLYARPAEEFWQSNPIMSTKPVGQQPPPSPIVTKELSDKEAKTYDLYVRKSLVVGPDGQPIRRSSVAESRRRSVTARPPAGVNMEESYLPLSTPIPQQPRRSITNQYSDARPSATAAAE